MAQTITPQMVKELRERTQAGMMDCKRALEATGGDMEKAVAWLREKGLAAAAKKAGRVAAEGVVDAYIHPGGRIGVLIEVNCETDFVARNAIFQQLVRDLAMHIAAAKPLYVSREDVPESVLEEERRVLRAAALNEGKPEHVVTKSSPGGWRSSTKRRAFSSSPSSRIRRRRSTISSRSISHLGENITVRRFRPVRTGRTRPAGERTKRRDAGQGTMSAGADRSPFFSSHRFPTESSPRGGDLCARARTLPARRE